MVYTSTLLGILTIATDQSKHLLTTKILDEFIKPFLDSQSENADPSRCIPIPTSQKSRGGLALADILRILASYDMQLNFSASLKEKTNNSTSSGGVAAVPAVCPTQELEEAEENSGRKTYEKELVKAYLSQSVRFSRAFSLA